MTETPPVNRYQRALESLIADLDYDLHKNIEQDEETGENKYPEIAERFARSVDGPEVTA